MASNLTVENAIRIKPKKIPNMILTKKGWEMKTPKGLKTIRSVRFGVPDEVLAELGEGGEVVPTLKPVTLVLKDFTANDDIPLVNITDIFVSATDKDGKPVSAEVALAGVEIPNTIGEHPITVTYEDGIIDDKPNKIESKCNVSITTALKPVTLVLKDYVGDEGVVYGDADIFVSATNAEGDTLTSIQALEGASLPTTVGEHDFTHTYTGTKIRGVDNTVTATCKITINKVVEDDGVTEEVQKMSAPMSAPVEEAPKKTTRKAKAKVEEPTE